MESKNLQKAIGLYIISEMKKDSTITLQQFGLLKQLIESSNENINELFTDFDPSDDIKMKNRFLHLLLSMNLNSSSDEENSYNSSTSYDDVSSPFATILLTKKKEKGSQSYSSDNFSSSSGFKLKKNEPNS